MFDTVNLIDELKRENQLLVCDQVVEEAKSILYTSVLEEQSIQRRLFHSSESASSLLHAKFNPDEVFTIGAIEKICTKYRLRFLDSILYKDTIPYEATLRIRELEAEHGVEFENFRIIAPAEKFRLKDSKKDPILVAEISPSRFLFIHKWGNDLSWSRRFLAFPFQNIQNLVISVAVVSFLVALLVPFQAQTVSENSIGQLYFFRSMIFFMTCGLLFCVALIYGILSSKDFSSDIWNDRYFN